MTEQTYTREDMARAWEEGAQAGWGATCEGWNAETAGEWTAPPSTPFRVANQETPNPYKQVDA